MTNPIELPYDEALAQKLRRFCFSFIKKENFLAIHPIDLLYMVRKNSSTYDEKKLESILQSDPLGMQMYTLATRLRDHGYPVRLSLDVHEDAPSKTILRVGRKGFRPDEDRTDTLMFLVAHLSDADIPAYIEYAKRLRKTAVVAFFIEKKINFLKISQTTFD